MSVTHPSQFPLHFERGGEELPALQCADGEAWRSKVSLEKVHPMKNSVSGSCVEAS